jgi:hypothetical protein
VPLKIASPEHAATIKTAGRNPSRLAGIRITAGSLPFNRLRLEITRRLKDRISG